MDKRIPNGILETVYLTNDSTFLTIPDSLVSHARDTVFQSWTLIETQLQQVDPAKEPEVYMALDYRANTLFAAWLQFRYVGVEAV